MFFNPKSSINQRFFNFLLDAQVWVESQWKKVKKWVETNNVTKVWLEIPEYACIIKSVSQIIRCIMFAWGMPSWCCCTWLDEIGKIFRSSAKIDKSGSSILNQYFTRRGEGAKKWRSGICQEKLCSVRILKLSPHSLLWPITAVIIAIRWWLIVTLFDRFFFFVKTQHYLSHVWMEKTFFFSHTQHSLIKSFLNCN